MTTLIQAPLISVLTPTWNRAGYLERVWNGLNSQTCRNFEWIVANDGSADDTLAKLHGLVARSNFPVVILDANIRIGKAVMDNKAIAQARGEFVLWNDSDDYLLPQCIALLMDTWNSIPESKRDDYVGVTALCASNHGIVSTTLPHQGRFDTTWNDLAEKHRVTGDMLYLAKASALRSFPFPEVDFMIPEGVVWTALGHMRTRVHPEVLQIKEYKTPHCISFSGKMEYCRGRAYAMATSEQILRTYPRNVKTRLWRLITYIRCSLHGEIGFWKMVRLWESNSLKPTFFFMLPVGYLMAMKDRWQGKVRQTHREFIVASNHVSVTCTRNR